MPRKDGQCIVSLGMVVYLMVYRGQRVEIGQSGEGTKVQVYAFGNFASKHKLLGMTDRVCFWKKGTFFFCQQAWPQPPPPPSAHLVTFWRKKKGSSTKISTCRKPLKSYQTILSKLKAITF